jgi:hypothetical protein
MEHELFTAHALLAYVTPLILVFALLTLVAEWLEEGPVTDLAMGLMYRLGCWIARWLEVE